jgi:drug/metabolite transporter (DMT)-like permease
VRLALVSMLRPDAGDGEAAQETQAGVIIWLCVLVRCVANPYSNVLQKLLARRAADPLFIICATHGLLSLACLPLVLAFLPPRSGEFWLNISASAALAVAGNVLLVQAVKRCDLSVLGPLNAYKAVVSLVPGMIFLGEVPGVMDLSGIGLVVAGSYGLVDRDRTAARGSALARLFRDRGVQYRVAALVLTATEAVFLKRALLASSWLVTFAVWSLLGFGISVVAVATLPSGRVRHEFSVLRGSKRAYLTLFVTTGLMQLATVVTLEWLHVGPALALFQTSALLSVVLGYQVFRERHVLKRLVGSAVMAAGAALIIVGQ